VTEVEVEVQVEVQVEVEVEVEVQVEGRDAKSCGFAETIVAVLSNVS